MVLMDASPSLYLNATTGTIIDTNHPYYRHPSDHPGMVLITITLTEQNYSR